MENLIREYKVIDMIYHYVFFKTTWHADIETFFSVDISDHLLEAIGNSPAHSEVNSENYNFDLLCFNVLLLS